MGTLVFQATLGGAVNIIGPNIANTINFTLPSADGSSGQTWTTNGSGVLAFGTLGIAGGGTGQITATAAFNALAPSQTGNSGKYLTTDGTNTSWGTNPLGTVTSVAATVPSFLSISGSPITTSGTLAISLSGTALPTTSGGTGLTSFTSGGVVYASSTSALATGSALTFDGASLDLGTVGAKVNFATTGSATRNYVGGSADGYSLEMVTQRGASQPLTYKQDYSVGHVWSVAGSTALTLNSTSLYTASGINVGIGTSSPAYKLDVQGSDANIAQFTSSGASTSFRINNTNANAWGGNLAILTGGTAAGYFGTIGSLLGTTTQDLAVYATSGNGFRVYTNGNNLRATFDSAGNLGIGTSSPSQKLSVKAGNGDQAVFDNAGERYTQVNWSNSGALKGAIWADNTNSLFEMYGHTGIGLSFYTNALERARIDSSGNLLVGTTSAVASTTTFGQDNGITISRGAYYRQIYLDGSGNLYFYNGTNQGYLNSAGAWTNASDARLKNSIVDIKHGLSAVMNTQPRSYKMNNLDGNYIGFVAQELQDVIPEVVSGDPEKQLGVDYGSLVAVAFKAIQEQQAIIESLKARLDAANL